MIGWFIAYRLGRSASRRSRRRKPLTVESYAMMRLTALVFAICAVAVVLSVAFK